MKKVVFSLFIIGTLVVSRAAVAEAKASSYGPTALCRDYTYSYSLHHQGTCSHHGGVKRWYK